VWAIVPQWKPYPFTSNIRWKKSCITLDGWNPINNGINLQFTSLPTGAGFRWHQNTCNIWNISHEQYGSKHDGHVGNGWRLSSNQWRSPWSHWSTRPIVGRHNCDNPSKKLAHWIFLCFLDLFLMIVCCSYGKHIFGCNCSCYATRIPRPSCAAWVMDRHQVCKPWLPWTTWPWWVVAGRTDSVRCWKMDSREHTIFLTGTIQNRGHLSPFFVFLDVFWDAIASQVPDLQFGDSPLRRWLESAAPTCLAGIGGTGQEWSWLKHA
jgi:hypothetical protein